MADVTSTGSLAVALKQRVAKLTNAREVHVGFPEGRTYPDGTSLPMVAAIQEFGAPSRGIPARPFMRNTIAEHGDEWPERLAALLQANAMDAEKALGHLGEVVAGQLRDAITSFSDPGNAPATVKRKGFDAPLRDSGHMLNSITVEVVE